MGDVFDVAVETLEGNFYQFLSVKLRVLRSAVDKGCADGTVLSLVSTDSAALVIPWRTINRIMFVSVEVEARDDNSWVTIWDRATGSRVAKKSKKKKVAHGSR